MKRPNDWISIAIITAAVGVMTLCVTLNPVYLDEVAYAITLGRFLSEGMSRLWFFPHCSSSFITRIPLNWWPASIILELLYGLIKGLFGLRLIGVGVALLNIIVYRSILVCDVPDRKADRYACWLSCFGIGALPFLFVMTRPEGLCLLGAQSVILLGLRRASAGTESAWAEGISAMLLLLLVMALCPIHPLGVLICPLYFWAAKTLLSSWGRRGILAAVLIALMMQAAALHQSVASCPEQSQIQSFYADYVGKNQLSLIRLPAILLAKFSNIVHSASLINAFFLSPNYRFGLIPKIGISSDLVFVRGVVNGVVLLFLANLVFCNALLLPEVFGRMRRLEIDSHRLWLVVALWVTLIFIVGAQPKHFNYRLVMLFPLLSLATALIYRIAPNSSKLDVCRFAVSSLPTLCLVSIVGVSYIYLPEMIARLSGGRFSDQPTSVGILSDQIYSSQIQKAMTECNFPDPALVRRPLVDETTFWQFRDSRQPVLFYYLALFYPPADSSEFYKWLRQGEISEIMVLCAGIPEQLSDIPFTRSGGICCLNSKELSELTERRAERFTELRNPEKGVNGGA